MRQKRIQDRAKILTEKEEQQSRQSDAAADRNTPMCCTSCDKHGSYSCYLMDTTKPATCSSQFWSNSGKSTQNETPKSIGVTFRGAERSGFPLFLVDNKPQATFVRHLSQRLYTERNQTSTEQSHFIHSKLCACVIFVCIKKYRYVQQEVKER